MPATFRVRWPVPFPAPVALGVSTNAVFTGFTTVALPLALADRGASKPGIAAFFVVGALAAAGLNLTVGAALRRRGGPRLALVGCALTSSAGLAVVAVSDGSWHIYPAAAAIMTMSVLYPLYVGIAGTLSGRSAARTVGGLRTLYVGGYLAGLGLYSLTVVVENVVASAVTPMRVAIALALVMAVATAVPMPRGSAEAPATEASVDEPVRSAAAVGVVTVAAAVLLMRAADSLRLVYLPLYSSNNGISHAMIGGLFAATVVAEIVVLAPLSAAADRLGSRAALLAVCTAGAASFGLTIVGTGYPLLLASQIVYAVYAAGFQSIGMVLLGQSMRSGLGGGASLYTAVVQVGGTVGVLAPLLVPGYSAAVFVIALAFCLAAGGLLTVDPMLRRRTSRRSRALAG